MPMQFNLLYHWRYRESVWQGLSLYFSFLQYDESVLLWISFHWNTFRFKIFHRHFVTGNGNKRILWTRDNDIIRNYYFTGLVSSVLHWGDVSKHGKQINSIPHRPKFSCFALKLRFQLIFQNEVVASEIYNSCWYLLEPNDRRLVHTFQTIIQRPITILAFGVQPVNLFSFPDLLDTMYSQVQVLRTLQFKK